MNKSKESSYCESSLCIGECQWAKTKNIATQLWWGNKRIWLTNMLRLPRNREKKFIPRQELNFLGILPPHSTSPTRKEAAQNWRNYLNANSTRYKILQMKRQSWPGNKLENHTSEKLLVPRLLGGTNTWHREPLWYIHPCIELSYINNNIKINHIRYIKKLHIISKRQLF